MKRRHFINDRLFLKGMIFFLLSIVIIVFIGVLLYVDYNHVTNEPGFDVVVIAAVSCNAFGWIYIIQSMRRIN